MRYNTVAGKIYLSNGCYSVCFLANYGGSAVLIWCVMCGKANGRAWLDIVSLVHSSHSVSRFYHGCAHCG
jgi:hypothetical protein